MGWQATGWAFKAPIPNPGAKFVLVALAERAGNEDDEQDWTCYPSIETIAAYTAQGYRTIQRHLDWLESEGFISRQRRTTAKGRKGAYNFTLHRHPVARDKMAGGQDAPTDRPNGAVEVARIGQTEPVTGTGHGTVEAIASVGGADEVRQAFNAYNAMVVAMGGSPAKSLNDDRRRRLKARLKDCGGLDGWCEQMRRVPESPFLAGQTHHHFGITLDFLLQPSSFTKLVEGQYHDPNRSQTDGKSARYPAAPDRVAERQRAREDAVIAGAQEAAHGGKRQRWRL